MTHFNFMSLLTDKGLSLDDFTNRQKVELLEYAIRQDKGLVDIKDTFPLDHYICNGVYIRRIVLLKDTLTIGKVHKTDHLSFISEGDVSVMTDTLERIKGPHTFISPAGIKRAVWAHEDTVWHTYHATTKTDIKEIEDSLVHSSDLTWIKDLELLTWHL